MLQVEIRVPLRLDKMRQMEMRVMLVIEKVLSGVNKIAAAVGTQLNLVLLTC